MLRHALDGIATVGVILGVAGIAGVIEFWTSPVPCVIAIAAGVGAGMLSSRIGKTWYVGETNKRNIDTMDFDKHNNSPITLASRDY